jgi:sterol desaturase/sphingolipid hydroxylase (fatty acid hydroxylase superfamily)
MLGQEAVIRLACFGGVLLLMALWEALAPRRQLTVRRPWRWFSNLGLVALNTLAGRFLVPLGAVGVALAARERGWGLLNNLDAPGWLAVALSVVVLDLVVYLQHVLFHALPVLWRLHMVHHADLDFDVTTGVRFHTIEILLSLGLKAAAVVLLGAPALGVLIFETLLNGTSMFNHGNVRLPGWLDRLLRLVVVTPEMHRVHHSAVVRETNSNFGFNLPWWDFLFGTYRAQPAAGHEHMTIGLAQFQDERTVERLHGMLLLPFVGQVGNHPISRGGRETGSPGPETLETTAQAGAKQPQQDAIPGAGSQARDRTAATR